MLLKGAIGLYAPKAETDFPLKFTENKDTLHHD
jgi:hypothetical protein